MENGNESRGVIGDSRKRYRCSWAEIGKYWPGKYQSDYRIRHRALWKKKLRIFSCSIYGPHASHNFEREKLGQ